ncbi:MAG: hypothetical protein AAF682_16030 [Planctomycetota bacterium]
MRALAPALLACFWAAATAPAAQEVTARAHVEPLSVAVGEPLEVVLELRHPAGLRPRAEEPLLDPSSPWVFLEHRGEPPRPDGAELERTVLVWKLLCLSPGEAVDPPALFYSVRTPGGGRLMEVDAAPVPVTGLLAEGEDAPRPIAGLRTLEEPPPAPSPWPLLGGGAALACLCVGLALIVRSRRLRGPKLAPAPALAQRIEALRGLSLGERARQYELTRLVREALDERSGTDRSGLTDEEWARAISADGGLSEPSLRAASELFEQAARTKYAGEMPTGWAVDEAFERARTAVAAQEVES